MSKFVIGVVVGIAISTWGIEGTQRMLSSGISYIQNGANAVEQTITSSGPQKQVTK